MKEAVKNPLKGILSYKMITKNLNFFLFLSFLSVLYIANGHMADKTIRNIHKAELVLKDLEFEYKTVKAEVMYKSEEVNVLKSVEPLQLVISKDVPERLQPIKKP